MGNLKINKLKKSPLEKVVRDAVSSEENRVSIM